MGVIKTYEWLKSYRKEKKNSISENIELQRKLICSPLEIYFKDASPEEIQYHLHQYGMFLPDHKDIDVIDHMFEEGMWKTVLHQYKKLRLIWDGPDVPVFLLPANQKSKQLREELNGQSGVSHEDKVFLFVGEHSEKDRLRALITHEYNHVCRLDYLRKEQKELTLLDALLLEGLAEHAVQKHVGDEYMGPWTQAYPAEKAKTGWDRWVKSNIDLKKHDPNHELLMYGKGRYPKWLGYNIGYHIISSFYSKNQVSETEALQTPSQQILEHSMFG
ncbi:DUF2268 domain-containing putative Zn-dependent protease [Bacillaceae bacterium S4-13-56]